MTDIVPYTVSCALLTMHTCADGKSNVASRESCARDHASTKYNTKDTALLLVVLHG